MSLDRLMVRIYTDPKDYKYGLAWLPTKGGFSRSQTKWEVLQVPNPRKLVVLNSEDECKSFIQARCNPREVQPKIYSDICRCGVYDENGKPKVWDYIRCGELIFERCPNCHLPMRHDVMLELNRPLVEDFDLDAFLNT